MQHWLNKKEMTEEDIKTNFITPAIQSKWGRQGFTMETKVQFTDGKVKLSGNAVVREAPKKADYVLYRSPYHPIAVVEAKDNNHSVSFGIQQAKEYAKMLDVPFAYSSNGDKFCEYDFLTGLEREFPMEEFPSPEELIARFRKNGNGGQGITPAQEAIMKQPYYSGQGVHTPRYYQRVAINRTLDAIARNQNRILLVMATGTGKTYTAFQIVYRLLKSGAKRKILYLADRNNLVDQTIDQDFAPLAKSIHKVNYCRENSATITSYEVYFALYQQMIGDNGAKHYEEMFRPEFFDLIIVDECHRGSASEDSQWRSILEYFTGATQIGMTATPKETKYVSNIDYFGEPLYTYSLKNGIDDGFLAPFRVINVKTNIGDGWRPTNGQLDINGNPIEDRIYTNSDYDYNIIIQDRISQVAGEITEYLKKTDRMAKTIVFCANEEHAENMRKELVKCNSDMMKQNPDYIVRITGSDVYGKKKIKSFISTSTAYPVIATTSELLSTGSDCKMTKLIVLDQTIGSMTKFKQVIGRGTRILWDKNKTHFVVMDFRNVTRHFADPDWDGPIQQADSWGETPDNPPGNEDDTPDSKPDSAPKIKPIVGPDGCRVEIIGKVVSIYDTGGKLLKQENIIDYTRSSVIGQFVSLENFINKWENEKKKEKIRDLLHEQGIDLEKMKEAENLTGVDDFDYICHVAFDRKPLTRRERAENVKKRDFLSKYSASARSVLETLLDHYAEVGIYDTAPMPLLNLKEFEKYGSKSRIVDFFGGKDNYIAAVNEVKRELYKTSARV